MGDKGEYRYPFDALHHGMPSKVALTPVGWHPKWVNGAKLLWINRRMVAIAGVY